jgi:hypothetical protein
MRTQRQKKLLGVNFNSVLLKYCDVEALRVARRRLGKEFQIRNNMESCVFCVVRAELTEKVFFCSLGKTIGQ